MAWLPFARNLRRYRRQKGLTQAEVGRLSGYAQGHISNLERGIVAPSMTVLERLAGALGLYPAELLMADGERAAGGSPGAGVSIINEQSRDRLAPPVLEDGRVMPGSNKVFCAPGLRARGAFAAYLTDDAMAPEFRKGDLVVFSLTRPAVDGDPSLVDTGKRKAIFRTVLSLPGGVWRLQPKNPQYEPVTIKAKPDLRMWPAIGRWQVLAFRTRRQRGTA